MSTVPVRPTATCRPLFVIVAGSWSSSQAGNRIRKIEPSPVCVCTSMVPPLCVTMP